MAAVQTPVRRTEVVSAPTVAERVRAWLRDPWFWFAALVCLATIAFSTGTVAVPLDRDEGAFLAIAQRVLRGGVPYRDVFDHKGPAIYYYLAGVLALTSPLSPLQRVLVARGGVVIVDLITGLGIFILGRRWWTREVGLLAALFWFLAVPLYNGDQVFTEPLAVAPTVWALIVAERWPHLRGAFVAGLLLALGSMFKQTAILVLPAVAVILLAATAPSAAWWRPSRLGLTLLGALIAGAGLPWAMVAAAFALVGGLGPMLQQVVLDSLIHYPADAWGMIAAVIRSSVDAFRVMWLMCALVIVVGLVRWIALRRAPSPGAIALASVMVLTAAPFRVHAYNHYFLQLVPAASLLAAMGLMAALDIWRSAYAVHGAAGGVPVVAGRALLAPALVGALLLVGMTRPLPTTQWREAYPNLQAQMRIGDWIASYVPLGTHVLVLPAEPGYYYLANRTTDERYVYLLPVDMTPSLMDRLSAQIVAHHYPVLVWQQSGGGDGHEPYFAGLYSTIKANYHVVAAYQAPEVYIFMPNG
jgi:4-amino-4-deoxy-L-arabinose transferase-like glycosyltransferase